LSGQDRHRTGEQDRHRDLLTEHELQILDGEPDVRAA
jgi:hypothetical protein